MSTNEATPFFVSTMGSCSSVAWVHTSLSCVRRSVIGLMTGSGAARADMMLLSMFFIQYIIAYIIRYMKGCKRTEHVRA